MRNMLATLFLSQGVPMLLGGDEIGRTQRGNNNAYCQDNELSWYHWDLDDRRKRLLEFTRRMIALRKKHQILQQRRFFVGNYIWESQSKDIAWLRPDGIEMTPSDWQKPWIQALAMVLGGDAIPMVDERGERMLDDGVLILMNAHHEPIEFKLPAEAEGGPWLVEIGHVRTRTTSPISRTRGPTRSADAASPCSGSRWTPRSPARRPPPRREWSRRRPSAAAVAPAWWCRCSRSGRDAAGAWATSPTCRASPAGRRRPACRSCSSCR